MVTIDNLFQTKTAKKPYPLALHITIYLAYVREYPPPPHRGEKRVADYESRCLRKGDYKEERCYLFNRCVC